jgi:hypothetical protein
MPLELRLALAQEHRHTQHDASRNDLVESLPNSRRYAAVCGGSSHVKPCFQRPSFRSRAAAMSQWSDRTDRLESWPIQVLARMGPKLDIAAAAVLRPTNSILARSSRLTERAHLRMASPRTWLEHVLNSPASGGNGVLEKRAPPKWGRVREQRTGVDAAVIRCVCR